MITDRNGQKVTAKMLAQDLLMDSIAVARGYWTEKLADQYELMTPREREQFSEHLKKQSDRIARMFGYEESWEA